MESGIFKIEQHIREHFSYCTTVLVMIWLGLPFWCSGLGASVRGTDIPAVCMEQGLAAYNSNRAQQIFFDLAHTRSGPKFTKHNDQGEGGLFCCVLPLLFCGLPLRWI